jgi:hypothetical protein
MFLLLAALVGGCSDDNSNAPPPGEPHPADFVLLHADQAQADLASCQVCHGVDFRGSGEAVSCFSCHAFNAAPPFTIHPTDWADPFVDHRAFASANGFSSCAVAACHGDQQPVPLGGTTGPSCATATFTNAAGQTRSCHEGGPGVAPHPLDGSYLSGAAHGPDAKADLTACQNCHGQPGGPGTNPRFNDGINSAGGQGCEPCHGVNYAHPPAWAGPNTTFHYNAGNIQGACTLCHGVALDGVGGVGVSCVTCHASAQTFTLNCAFCHGFPPTGAADLATPTGVNHGNVANIGSHDQCALCHGVKQGLTAGTFAAVANYRLFNAQTGVNGDHWDGNINMNGPSPATGTGYNETNFGCDNAACHGNDAGHQLTDSGIPVEFGDYGSGEATAGHPLDGTFLDPANHGPVAKADLTFCQGCHGTVGGPGSNPRFNLGINRIAGTGCEGCHNDLTAHPAVGAREAVNWYDVGVTHSDAGNLTVACGLCHGAALDGVGGVGPSCLACHTADPVANPAGCVSCHNTPPNGGGPAGAVTPNRTGQHDRVGHTTFINAVPGLTCARCHDGAGFGTAAHFDQLRPADVSIPLLNPQDTIIPVSDGTNTTCNGGCHIPSLNITYPHDNRLWY